MKKRKVFKKKKTGIIKSVMPTRYGFYILFGYNQQTGFLYPLYNTWINGAYFPAGMNIQRGPFFGGIDLYQLAGKDVAAIWQGPPTNTLTIQGFYQ